MEEGKGINLANSSAYLSRNVCLARAKTLQDQGYCVNMSLIDVAMEIHAHAVILYLGVPVAIASLAVGAENVASAIFDIAKHGADGIDLGDNNDSFARVAAYNVVWSLGVH